MGTDTAIVATVGGLQPVRATPDDLIRTALAQDDVDLDRVERFYELKRRYEADEARKAYVDAMASFKSERVEIIKDKIVGYKTKDGDVVGYSHATIGNVVGVVCEALGRHGFSHRWDTKQEGGLITVSCVITHRLGHSESTALSGAPDDSGKKNKIQQTASTISYLQRYTLLAATGLATRDQEDDDGRGAGGEDTETEEQRLAREAVESKEANWIAKIGAATTLSDYEGLRVDLIAEYGGSSSKVPKALRGFCVEKKAALSKSC